MSELNNLTKLADEFKKIDAVLQDEQKIDVGWTLAWAVKEILRLEERLQNTELLLKSLVCRVSANLN